MGSVTQAQCHSLSAQLVHLLPTRLRRVRSLLRRVGIYAHGSCISLLSQDELRPAFGEAGAAALAPFLQPALIDGRDQRHLLWQLQSADICQMAARGRRRLHPYTEGHAGPDASEASQGPEPSIERFFAPARSLGPGFSCVCWQLPGDFRCNEETLGRLRSFLPLLPRDVRQAVESRHPSWFTDAVLDCLRQHNTGFVINNSPHLPSAESVTADFVYLRFHGPGRLYASFCSLAELEARVQKITRFLESHDVYAYFNNDYGGYTIENAKTLRALVGIETPAAAATSATA